MHGWQIYYHPVNVVTNNMITTLIHQDALLQLDDSEPVRGRSGQNSNFPDMTNSLLTLSTSLANSLSTTPSKIKDKFLGVANVRVANERKKGVVDKEVTKQVEVYKELGKPFEEAFENAQWRKVK